MHRHNRPHRLSRGQKTSLRQICNEPERTTIASDHHANPDFSLIRVAPVLPSRDLAETGIGTPWFSRPTYGLAVAVVHLDHAAAGGAAVFEVVDGFVDLVEAIAFGDE